MKNKHPTCQTCRYWGQDRVEYFFDCGACTKITFLGAGDPEIAGFAGRLETRKDFYCSLHSEVKNEKD